MNGNLQKLGDCIKAVPPGKIDCTDELERLLATCWDQLDGGDEEAMTGSKLLGRMEDARWQPADSVLHNRTARNNRSRFHPGIPASLERGC